MHKRRLPPKRKILRLQLSHSKLNCRYLPIRTNDVLSARATRTASGTSLEF